VKAHELIEKEENWCKGASHKAGCYCAAQAIGHAYGDHKKRQSPVVVAMLRRAEKAADVPKHFLPWFNDTHTHAEIYAVLKGADI
jgi:hypothetical protein